MTTIPETQHHEMEFWGNCLNLQTWHEFVKQEMYGREMQLIADYGVAGEYDMRGRSVLDIGGGPVSMTLRCINSSKLVVADPIQWPDSALRRYRNYGIQFLKVPGEELSQSVGLFEEVWVYNVLQHVMDPLEVLAKACDHVAELGVLRVFEWLDIPADKCHPHVLTESLLWQGVKGMTVKMHRMPTLNDYWTPNAKAFVGVFAP